PDLPTPRISGSSSVATMIRMAEDGVGLAAVPLDIVRPQIEDGRLRLVDTDLPLASLAFTSTWPASPPNPLAQLVGHLADNAAKVRRSTVAAG
ncbi:MAG: LysR substrate-binding domain-containing protein, partial [Rhodospirillaceae bacterium]|nr:LysR substrate-binding domain-containing protein [Rhodospirillaceae bacterium]